MTALQLFSENYLETMDHRVITLDSLRMNYINKSSIYTFLRIPFLTFTPPT